MRIGVLSYYHVGRRVSLEESRLKQEGQILAATVRIFRAANCQLVFDSGGPSILHQGKRFPHLDVLIPRMTVLKHVELQSALLKQFQLSGVPVVNGFRPINRAKNKLNTMQILSHHGIPVPKTIVIRRMSQLDFAVKYLGGLPVILKSPFGSYGSGVVIADTKRSLTSSLGAIFGGQEMSIVLLQQFIRESKGKDIRVFVVGGKVTAAMMRQAAFGEFRSNIELGGAGEKVEITPDEASVALRAASVLGLEIAGVDIVRSDFGPLVLEVNGNPGFKKLEEVTGANVARAIIEHALSRAGKGDSDYAQ